MLDELITRHFSHHATTRPMAAMEIDYPSGRRLKLTSKTMHRLFAKETGMTFGEWRQQAHLLFALERLARGERVVDVALDSGYASQSAFSAMFRRHFGVPPNVSYR
ncbi:AraC family transcriptional regulator [Bradyrhizobium sp. WSM 1704]|uniref:helix-turn-helix domain-containing protein n=1 Tax=Bradyrhizobium semiaridum TaxID=2821404 RepID=UPI001CE2F50A|nr:helix-turn-helix domain-containing protein [Bradyrhizobium semiaridum]MCA6122748.1 AraC family transcriptional regulator [Bradyrhizobium semiaridum]